MLLQVMQVLSTLKIQILLIMKYKLKTESTIKSKLIELLTHLKGFKFVTTLVLMFKDIESKDKTKYYNIYSSSKAGEIISKSHIDDVFDYIYTTIIKNIQRS